MSLTARTLVAMFAMNDHDQCDYLASQYRWLYHQHGHDFKDEWAHCVATFTSVTTATSDAPANAIIEDIDEPLIVRAKLYLNLFRKFRRYNCPDVTQLLPRAGMHDALILCQHERLLQQTVESCFAGNSIELISMLHSGAMALAENTTIENDSFLFLAAQMVRQICYLWPIFAWSDLKSRPGWDTLVKNVPIAAQLSVEYLVDCAWTIHTAWRASHRQNAAMCALSALGLAELFGDLSTLGTTVNRHVAHDCITTASHLLQEVSSDMLSMLGVPPISVYETILRQRLMIATLKSSLQGGDGGPPLPSSLPVPRDDDDVAWAAPATVTPISIPYLSPCYGLAYHKFMLANDIERTPSLVNLTPDQIQTLRQPMQQWYTA